MSQKSQKAMSPDLQKHMALVREAARMLKPHHFRWMIDTLIRDFNKRIEKNELQITRHENFSGEPLHDDATREEQIATEKRFLGEHRDILVFLRALASAENMASAERFTRDSYLTSRWHRC